MARKKIKNVIITNLYHYSLFLTLLYIDENEYNDTLFIIPKKYNKRGINRVNFSFKYLSILKNNYKINNKLKAYIYILNNLYLRIILFFKRIFLYDTSNSIVYFNSIDFTAPIIFDFFKYKNAVLVEDGSGNLIGFSLEKDLLENDTKFNQKRNFIKKLKQKVIGLPTIQNIKYFISTKPSIYRYITTEVINIQEKWDNSSEYKRKFIFDFYNFDIDIMKKYNRFSILCPQPFSEDNLISEEEKIEIYKKAFDSIQRNEKIIIKPHPREKTDYTKIFPNAIVLSNSFPMELAKVSGIKFAKIYTVSSTVALNFSDSEIVLIKVEQNSLFQDLITKTLDDKNIKYNFI